MSTAPIDHGSASEHVTRDLSTPGRVLAVGAHPDDIEFGCGATLAKWAAAGAIVNHLVCTDGSRGTWDDDQDTDALVVMRKAEQLDAAKALGATGQVVFLGYTDGELESGLPQRSKVAYWIRRLKPDVLIAHDPWKRYRLHPDHRHAGLLAVEGLVAARDPHFFREHGLERHRPETLLLYEADEADHVEDVTGFADTKLTALYRHESQLRSTMKIDGDDGDAVVQQRRQFEDRIMTRLQEAGALVGVAHGEAFKAMRNL